MRGRMRDTNRSLAMPAKYVSGSLHAARWSCPSCLLARTILDPDAPALFLNLLCSPPSAALHAVCTVSVATLHCLKPAALVATLPVARRPLELSQLLWGLSSLQCRELSIYYAAVRRCIAVLQVRGGYGVG